MFRYHRVWSLLQPQRPRHPLVRALLGLFALCAFMLLLVIGAVVGVVLLAGSLLLRALRPSRVVASATHANDDAPVVDGDVIDGEYSVLRKPLHRISNH